MDQSRWSPDAVENDRFVAMCAGPLRDSIMEVAYEEDRTVGVPEVLSARPEDQALKSRQALRNILYIESLFAGDGFTRNAKGETKAAEMIVMTKSIAELEAFENMNLGRV